MADRQRRIRFIASATLLAFGGLSLQSVGNAIGIRSLTTVALYFAYLGASACLIAVLAGRLFRQHELRKLRFDIASAIILTTLVALPLGVVSAFQQIAPMTNATLSQADLNGPVSLIISLVLYFLLLPIFIATESVLAWCVKWRQAKKRAKRRRL